MVAARTPEEIGRRKYVAKELKSREARRKQLDSQFARLAALNQATPEQAAEKAALVDDIFVERGRIRELRDSLVEKPAIPQNHRSEGAVAEPNPPPPSSASRPGGQGMLSAVFKMLRSAVVRLVQVIVDKVRAWSPEMGDMAAEFGSFVIQAVGELDQSS